jgi:hypothetical protein
MVCGMGVALTSIMVAYRSLLGAFGLLFCLSIATGCTHTGHVSGAAVGRAIQDQTGERLRIEGYGEVTPSSTLRIVTRAGTATSVSAAEVCQTPQGLLVRSGDTCALAKPIAAWAEIADIEVSEFDGLTTTALVAGSAAAVGIAVLSLSKDVPHPSKPTAPKEEHPAQHDGAADGVALAARDLAMNVDVSRTAGTLMYLAMTMPDQTPSMGRTPDWSPAPTEPSKLTDSKDAKRLFSESEERKARWSPFVRGGAGLGVGSSGASGYGLARAGVLFSEFIELSAGALIERDVKGTAALLASANFGLQGSAPGERWLALYLGSSISANGDLFRIDPALGVRFQPMTDLWLGVYPLAMSYRSTSKNFNWSPSLDIGSTF